MTMPTITATGRRAGLLLLMAAALSGCSNLCPRQAPPPPPPHHPHDGPPRDPAVFAAMHDCMETLGEPRPDPGARPAPPRLSPADRNALDACLRAKGVQPLPPPPPRDPAFDAALQACRATLDLPDDHGPPSPEQRTRMDACLKEKGIERPAPPAGEAPPPAH